MNIFGIIQLVGLATETITKVEQAHRENGASGTGAIKKQEVESVLYAAIAGLEASGKLVISDRKGFTKDVSHMIDNIVGIANKSEWK